MGETKVGASSKDQQYRYIPQADLEIGGDEAVHITLTILSTEPSAAAPRPKFLIADMSSDILSKPLDVSQFGLIYAGAEAWGLGRNRGDYPQRPAQPCQRRPAYHAQL